MIRSICLVIAILLTGSAPSVWAQDSENSSTENWAAFRGDGTSLTSASNLPVAWDDGTNIAWTADVPGYGQSSPVIWGDRVFVTTMQGEKKETPTIACYGLTDGKEIWKKDFSATQVFTPKGQVTSLEYYSRSAPTPAVDAQMVFAFFESGELIATDHDGNVRWQRSLVKEYGEFLGNHGVGSSIAINDDTIFVLAAHEGPSYLLAVNKSTGENLWKADLDPKVSWSSPTLAGKLVLLSISGSVQAFNVTTGKPVWSIGEVSGNTVASITVHDDLAFVGSSERDQNFAVRFDPSGKSDKTEVVWRSSDASSSFGSPLYRDGLVYYVDKAGIAYAVDAASGETKWKERLSGSSWASPIGGVDRVYFFAKEGPTDVVAAGPEFKLMATNKLTVAGKLYGVAVADSRLVFRSGSRLVCVGNQDGPAQTITKAKQALALPDFPAAVTSFGAAVCNDHLYVYGGNMGAAHGYSVEGQNSEFRRVKLESGSEWESLGEVPRRQGLALVTYKGKVYRIGGFEARNAAGEDEILVSTPDFEVFDPATAKWTALAPLPEPRSSFDAVVAGDMLYVVGGWSLGQGEEDSQWHTTAWQMDLSQDNAAWKQMPAPPETRRAHSMAELNGKVYMLGGMDEFGDTVTSAFVLDTKTGKWSDAPELPGQPMDGFGSSAFNTGGRIVVSTFSGQVLQLSEDGTAWEQLPKLETGRFFHRLVAIDKTRFAILGGTSSTGKQTSVLVIDRTAKW